MCVPRIRGDSGYVGGMSAATVPDGMGFYSAAIGDGGRMFLIKNLNNGIFVFGVFFSFSNS